LKDLGINGKNILQWILGKKGAKVWTESISVRIGTTRGALVNVIMNLQIP